MIWLKDLSGVPECCQLRQETMKAGWVVVGVKMCFYVSCIFLSFKLYLEGHKLRTSLFRRVRSFAFNHSCLWQKRIFLLIIRTKSEVASM